MSNSSNVLFAFHIKINAEALGFWVFCENCFENHWIPSDISRSHSWIKYYMSTLQWGMQWIYPNSSLFGWKALGEMHVMAGLSNLWELMPDDLKWSWCKHNRNKVYNKYNAVKLSWNHPLPLNHGNIFFHKGSPGTRKVGDHCLWYQHNIFYFPRELNIFSKVATTLWAPEVNIGCNYEIHEQAKSSAPTKLGMRGQQPQP